LPKFSIAIANSNPRLLVALSLCLTIIVSLGVFTLNNVTGQTLETIIEGRKVFENNPQIKVGVTPDYIAANEITNKIYVANSKSGTISVIDSNSGGPVKNIPVGARPAFIAIDSDHNKIYVSNGDSDTVSVIDGNNDTEIGLISVGKSPYKILLGNGDYPSELPALQVFVANYGSNTVSVINTTSNKKEHDIPVGNSPIDMAAYYSKIYVANAGSNTVSVINTASNKKEHDIPVGNSPGYVMPDLLRNDKIYVANAGSNTVSVINTTSNKKEHDIPVGNSPIDMAADLNVNKFYVAASPSSPLIPGDGTVSVIDGNTDNETGRISMGKQLSDIASKVLSYNTYIPPLLSADKASRILLYDKIYVANAGSNTVSVINTTSNKKEHDIPVGNLPSHIAINNNTRMIYVVNQESNAVSVIDGSSNKVAAGVTLNTHPANAARILCDNKEYPTNIYLYIDIGTTCIVQPNKDFQFSGWVENLNRNSTIPLDDSSANLTVNRYGIFTANLIPLPPVIPPEYLVPLYGIIVSSIIGWSIPNIISWLNAKTHRKYLRECINQIGILDKNTIEERITRLYIDGKLNESHRQLLEDKIAEHYDKVNRSSGSPIK
jgi:YVTN family beta-propeller protein